MAKVILQNPVLGGLAESKYLGVENSFSALVGLDLQSEPGIIKVNQKLTKESGSTVDASVNAAVACSDGSSYFFLANGKVVKRTAAGSWSLERTISGNPAILEAREYEGYIYYATAASLGRWQIGTAWSGATDAWASFAIGDTGFHPMHEVNLVMYIGDGKYLAQVEDQAGTHVFTNNALDIRPPLRIKSLGHIGNELLIGTFINNNVQETQIIRWNTWSISFSSSDPVPEVGINSFLQTDNFVLTQVGTKGNLYQYANDVLQQVKRIPGSWGGANKAEIKLNATANMLGIPLFGLSNINGNPAMQGVYSFGKSSPNYPMAMALDYVISTGHTSNVEIGALLFLTGSGSTGDVLLVAWKDTTSGTEYGVDVLDLSNKFSGAYIDSRLIKHDRDEFKRVADIKVPYRLLPANTEIQIWVAKDHGTFAEIEETEIDTDNKYVHTLVGVEDVNTLEVRIKLIASANTAPEIEEIIIEFGDEG